MEKKFDVLRRTLFRWQAVLDRAQGKLDALDTLRVSHRARGEDEISFPCQTPSVGQCWIPCTRAVAGLAYLQGGLALANMNKYIVGVVLSLGFLAVPASALAVGLTSGQANSLIAVVQSAPGVPASAFVNFITAFSNITVNQATSLVAVVQSAPTAPANAFVDLLISFTQDTTTQAATTQSTAPSTQATATTQQASSSTPTISRITTATGARQE